MATITFDLSNEDLAELEKRASKLGLSVEHLVRIGVEDLLLRPDPEFENAAQYVLKKNAELYRRLA